MAKKQLKKGWKYCESFQEMMDNIEKGNFRFWIDNKEETYINSIENGIVEFTSQLMKELTDAFDNFDITEWNDDFSLTYEGLFEDFEKAFTALIEAGRISYPKRQ